MRTKCRSIATFHRPIHSHWSLPLRQFYLFLPHNQFERTYKHALEYHLQTYASRKVTYIQRKIRGPTPPYSVIVSQFLSVLTSCVACRLPNRVGNGILFRKHSSEQTQNGFLYSAEESAHSEAYEVYERVSFEARNGIKKNSLKNPFSSNYNVFRPRQLWNEIPRACFYFCSTERNSELFSPPRKGSEQNSKCLLLFLFHETEFRVVFSAAESFRMECRECASTLIP